MEIGITLRSRLRVIPSHLKLVRTHGRERLPVLEHDLLVLLLRLLELVEEDAAKVNVEHGLVLLEAEELVLEALGRVHLREVGTVDFDGPLEGLAEPGVDADLKLLDVLRALKVGVDVAIHLALVNRIEKPHAHVILR